MAEVSTQPSLDRSISSELKVNLSLGFLVVAGALLRIGHMLALRKLPFFYTLNADSKAYDDWAQKLASGNWIGNSVFYQDPLYPYFLGVFYHFFGRNLLWIRLFQIGLGTAVIVFVYHVSAKLFGKKSGLLSAALVAFYRPFIFTDNEIEKTSLGIFLVAVFILLYLKPKLHYQFFAGVTLALGVLVRANLLLLIPIAAFFRIGRNSKRAAPVALLLGASLILAPVLLRNRLIGREWVLTTAQSGQNFYMGNAPHNSLGDGTFPPFIRPHILFAQHDFAAYAEKQFGHPLTSGQVSSFWWGLSFKHALTSPAFFLRVMIQKVVLFWNNFEPPDNQSIYFLSLHSAVLRLPLVSFALLSVLFAIGAVAHCRGREAQQLLIFVGIYALSVSAFYLVSRYRIPIIPVMAVIAGGAFQPLEKLVSKQPVKLPWGPPFAGVVAGLVAHIPFTNMSREAGYAFGYTAMAQLYVRESNPKRAIESYEEALRLNPSHLMVTIPLAELYQQTRDYSAAQRVLEDGLKVKPDWPAASDFLRRLRQLH